MTLPFRITQVKTFRSRHVLCSSHTTMTLHSHVLAFPPLQMQLLYSLHNYLLTSLHAGCCDYIAMTPNYVLAFPLTIPHTRCSGYIAMTHNYVLTIPLTVPHTRCSVLTIPLTVPHTRCSGYIAMSRCIALMPSRSFLVIDFENLLLLVTLMLL
jgi:hypothetical protein